jgi:2-oxoglutarate ferredoxin oxidoreductase subunit gamma
MKHEETIISGFGGQGALFAGQLLAYAGIAEKLHVTWIPSYGPEMRGGTANCTVIVSEELIGAPIIRNPGNAIVLNLPSMEKYEPLVKPGGLLIVNDSLVPKESTRDDIEVVRIPASDIATELGNPRMANLVLLGAFIQRTGLVDMETLEEELEKHISERHRKWVAPNKEALERGAALAAGQQP